MKKSRLGYTTVELLVSLAICGVAALLISAFLSIPIKYVGGLNIEYSEGTRSGVVQKISKKGFIYDTWEGELNMGYNSTNENNQIIPAIFQFSVSSDEVAKLVQDAEASGKRVTLQYKEYILHGYHRGATPYDVIGVK